MVATQFLVIAFWLVTLCMQEMEQQGRAQAWRRLCVGLQMSGRQAQAGRSCSAGWKPLKAPEPPPRSRRLPAHLRTEVHAKGVAGVEDAGGVVKGEHGVCGEGTVMPQRM